MFINLLSLCNTLIINNNATKLIIYINTIAAINTPIPLTKPPNPLKLTIINVIIDKFYIIEPKLIRTLGNNVWGYKQRIPIDTPTINTYVIVYGNGTIRPILCVVFVVLSLVVLFVVLLLVLLLGVN